MSFWLVMLRRTTASGSVACDVGVQRSAGLAALQKEGVRICNTRMNVLTASKHVAAMNATRGSASAVQSIAHVWEARETTTPAVAMAAAGVAEGPHIEALITVGSASTTIPLALTVLQTNRW